MKSCDNGLCLFWHNGYCIDDSLNSDGYVEPENRDELYEYNNVVYAIKMDN